jgi:hypothetical protein
VTGAESQGARLEGDAYLPYLYPPVFLLLSLPLAALPYLASMGAFLAAGYAATCACLKKILPKNWPWLPVLAMPGAMMNAIITQNGFLSATCFAGALLLLERRPALSGACLGIFAYKPHLAIGIPVALAAARRWRALFSCAATACGLAALSWLAFGTLTWLAFLRATPVTRAALETHAEIWTKLVSVYGAIRVLHGSAGLGFAAQAIAIAIALVVLARIAARRPGAGAEISALVSATMLCTPYVMDYDLVCLGVPMAWIAAEATKTGWRRWEKTVLLACYMLPLFARWLNIHAHLPLTPFIGTSLLAIVWERVAAAPKGKKRKKVFFFEKKKQKTFVRCRGLLPGTYQKT